MKLNEAQTLYIDKALQKIGIHYYDVRLELTDHVASYLEKQEGDFNDNLATYIKENKKMLRRLNFRFMMVGARKGLKLLIANLLSWPVALVFIAIITMGKIIQQFAVPDDVRVFMWLIFCACNIMSSHKGVMTIIRKRDDYSFTGGIGFLPGVIFFTSIPVLNMMPSANYLIVYFALASAFAMNIYFTVKKLYRQYRSIYKVL